MRAVPPGGWQLYLKLVKMSVESITYGEAIRKSNLVRFRRRRFWLGEKLDHPDDEEEIRIHHKKRTTAANQSYVVPCTSDFRDEVLALATRRGARVGNIARAVLLLLPGDAVRALPDPGEPALDDREPVTLKSGASIGKIWRRKPRLQVRLPAGLESADIRRVLAMALAMDSGEVALSLERGGEESTAERLDGARAEIARLRKQVKALSFEPLEHHVRSRAAALHVLGFAPGAAPDQATVRRRYRARAAIFHPDSTGGDHRRMSQLNEAVAVLTRKS